MARNSDAKHGSTGARSRDTEQPATLQKMQKILQDEFARIGIGGSDPTSTKPHSAPHVNPDTRD